MIVRVKVGQKNRKRNKALQPIFYPHPRKAVQHCSTTASELSTTSFYSLKQIVFQLEKRLPTALKIQFHKSVKTKVLAKWAFHSFCEDWRGIQGAIPTSIKTVRVLGH
ncbi:MAG: hypothetical protein IT258_09770 [Saprospiraceae bacterium]|nr:hypothetical protein [Saprospiraceae bacterium]